MVKKYFNERQKEEKLVKQTGTFRRLFTLLLILVIALMASTSALAQEGAEETVQPTEEVTQEPTAEVTEEPTGEPVAEVTEEATQEPAAEVTEEPTEEPVAEVTEEPIQEPVVEPTEEPTRIPLAETGDSVSEDSGVDLTKDGEIISPPSVMSFQRSFAVEGESEKQVSIIVQLEDDALISYDGGLEGLAPTSPKATGRDKVDVSSLESQAYLGYLVNRQATFERNVQKAASGRIVHKYQVAFNGVSMVVPEDQVENIAGLPGVKAVYLDELRQLDTDRSPRFIGAYKIWRQLGGSDEAGEGVVVGVLDSGIWPEHPSLSDPDPNGNPYPAAPPQWSGTECDFGDTAYNPNDAPFTCNNKLLGAYDFTATYKGVVGLLPGEFDSARDADGHGTHTATTAAGNGGVDASIFGMPYGTVSGIAPRARVVMYKVCGDEGCFNSDSIAAIEQAILDGVDVINYSISGGGAPYSDAVEMTYLDAYNAGVFIAASAGNSGPDADTVAHRGPWMTTVAASTSDRHFLSTLVLTADNGDTLELVGATVTEGVDTPLPVIYSPDSQCTAGMAAGTFSGELVICDRGGFARVEKSFNAANAGAGAMILRNLVPQGLNTDNHFIPSIHLDSVEGAELGTFMDTHTGVVATFDSGTATRVKGDVVASFSSRGGPGQTLGINKPDVTAPGVQILAGNTPMGATATTGRPGELFQSIQGTSMSSPQVAGAAALIKDLHPDWTPGQIKSALMTTAKDRRLYKEDGETPFDPYDAGSGRIDLRVAGNPGLTFDETAANYVALEDELWNANYPSVYHPVMPGQITVERTAKDVTGRHRGWFVWARSGKDWDIKVPRFIYIEPNGEATFEITIDARNVPLGEVRHGEIEMFSGRYRAHIPVSFVRGQPAVKLDKTCTPEEQAKGQAYQCTIDVENTAFDSADVNLVDELSKKRLQLVPESVVGADVTGPNKLEFNGTLAGAAPPLVNVAVDPLASPYGYVPLAGFGSTDIGATDESIANFNVPDFVYAGETYNQIGIVSNGYIVVGGGTGADVDYINSDLPDASPPNNTLAPFWTDLNPVFGGRVLLNTLGDGTNSWIVVEWESVSNWGDGETNTFQVWIGYNGVEDISYVYGTDISDGDGGFLTVGAENAYGNSGGTVYLDGAGTPPAPSYPAGDYEVDVFSVPGAPGGTHTITFDMIGKKPGSWQNCAEMTGSIYQGVLIDCVNGKTTGK